MPALDDEGQFQDPEIAKELGFGPSPSSPKAPAAHPGVAADDVDLPAPARPAPGGVDEFLPAPSRPAPGGADGFQFEFPTETSDDDLGLDLPAPADSSSLPKPSDSALFARQAGLPAPDSGDLPVPKEVQKTPGGLPPPADSAALPLPVADLDLPAPAGLDLPAPVGLDLPTPAGVDLPTPAGVDLPTPAGVDLLQPAALEVEPAQILPRSKGGDELEPAMHVEPHRNNEGVAPLDDAEFDVDVEADVRARPGPAAAAAAAVPLGHRVAPRELRRAPVRRGVLYAAAGLLGLGLVGGGIYASGLLDSDVGGGGRGVRGAKGKGKGGAAAASDVRERSDKVLAKFAADDPSSYQQAMAMAEADGDAVGQAEAALLLHYRYGPDPVLSGQAAALLEPFAGATEPFVTRVIGLAALSGGNLEAAEAALAGDDLRTRLYRGFLRMAQDKPAEALAEANAVLANTADDRAAQYLKHAAAIAADPNAVQALRDVIDGGVEHAGLRELLARTSLDRGELAQARIHADALSSIKGATKAYQARILGLRGRIAAAGGDPSNAMLRYDQALELEPNDTATRLDRIRLLIGSREYGQARSDLAVIVKNQPDLMDAVYLQAELAIATGEGDAALEILGQVAQKGAESPRVPYLIGQVHAMRMAVDEARTAFDTARTRDPAFDEASIAEAQLLAQANNFDEGLSIIDAAMKRAQGDRDRAGVLWLARARLLSDNQQQKAAIAALDKALEAHPGSNDALLLRGNLYLATGDATMGRADLNTLFDRTGGYPGLAAPLGRIFIRDGEIEKLSKLVEGKLDDPRASEEVKLVGARLRLAQNKAANAKGLIDQVLASNPGSWEGHLLLAQVHVQQGEYAAAADEIRQATPRLPNSEVELWQGQILEYNGRPDDAMPHYRRALELDTLQYEARFLYGRLLAARGAAESAMVELKQVVEVKPDYQWAWLEIGRAQVDLGQRDGAIKALTKATEGTDKVYEAHYLLGRLHGDANKHKAAAAALTKAVEIPEAEAKGFVWPVDAWRRLGRARMQAGNKAGAKQAFEKFKAVARPDDPGRAEVDRLMRDL